MRQSLAKHTRPTAFIVLCALALVGCASTPVDDVRISVKRIALSLAFENEDLAEPVSPQQIIQYIPAPDDLIATGDFTQYRSAEQDLDLEPVGPLCPKAPENTLPKELVTATITDPPKPGWYRRHNQGKLSVAGGAVPITIPFPRMTFMEIKDVHDIEKPNVAPADRRVGEVADDEAPAVAGGFGAARGTNTVTRFTMVHHIATITVTDLYEFDNSAMRLVKRTTKTGEGESVINLTPQVTWVIFGNFGGSWNEAGADRENSTGMTVEGSVTKQERVDMCGQVIDSLRFENDEQMVNLRTQETSGTSDAPNAYNIAPHKNGLIIREEKHFSQVVTVGDLKLVIDWDYVSTLGHLDPYPTREAAVASTLS